MKVQEFLDISDFNNYLIVNEKGHCIDDILDKYNAMKTCGFDNLISVSHKLKLIKNKIEVICVLRIDSCEE
ncbi:MAG: hypothetical protein E6356_13700 [Terrisporobacter othiniensis]|nr:hypothetical protein [Terrisporobacter othiniensis]